LGIRTKTTQADQELYNKRSYDHSTNALQRWQAKMLAVVFYYQVTGALIQKYFYFFLEA
jgi:hypothetical protein